VVADGGVRGWTGRQGGKGSGGGEWLLPLSQADVWTQMAKTTVLVEPRRSLGSDWSTSCLRPLTLTVDVCVKEKEQKKGE